MKTNVKKAFEKELDKPAIRPGYTGTGKLKDKTALITGGDSGIGRSVAAYFAREGANTAIVYLKNDDDANETKGLVEAEGMKCLLIKGDISSESFCKKIISQTHKQFGSIDILVNNAGRHNDDDSLEDISKKQMMRTFEVNIFSMFYITRFALEVMEPGSTIINTASITAYRGSDHLIDYAATKGAVVSFTRSLSTNLAEKNIRVNAVAPGPVWTPLVVDAFDKKRLQKFGKDTPLGRAGYPYEIAPAYVFLASEDSTFVTGQVMHINGGDIING